MVGEPLHIQDPDSEPPQPSQPWQAQLQGLINLVRLGQLTPDQVSTEAITVVRESVEQGGFPHLAALDDYLEQARSPLRIVACPVEEAPSDYVAVHPTTHQECRLFGQVMIAPDVLSHSIVLNIMGTNRQANHQLLTEAAGLLYVRIDEPEASDDPAGPELPAIEP